MRLTTSALVVNAVGNAVPIIEATFVSSSSKSESSSSRGSASSSSRTSSGNRILRTEVDFEVDVDGRASPVAAEHSSSQSKQRTAARQTQPGSPTGRASSRSKSSTVRAKNAKIEQRARAETKRRSKRTHTSSQAYAIRGFPNVLNDQWSGGTICGADGQEALVDKSTKLGVRCCGEKASVERVGGTFRAHTDAYYVDTDDEEVDCDTAEPSGVCDDDTKTLTWDETEAACAALGGRRVCTLAEIKRMRAPSDTMEAMMGAMTGCWKAFPHPSGDPTKSYASCPNGQSGPEPDPEGNMTFHFDVSAGVTLLKFQGTFKPENSSLPYMYNDDSFWLSWDGAGGSEKHMGAAGTYPLANFSTFKLIGSVEDSADRAFPNPSAGRHSFQIRARESGTRIGRLRLVATGGTATFVQEDVSLCAYTGGGCDNHCVWTADEAPSASEESSFSTGLIVGVVVVVLVLAGGIGAAFATKSDAASTSGGGGGGEAVPQSVFAFFKDGDKAEDEEDEDDRSEAAGE